MTFLTDWRFFDVIVWNIDFRSVENVGSAIVSFKSFHKNRHDKKFDISWLTDGDRNMFC